MKKEYPNKRRQIGTRCSLGQRADIAAARAAGFSKQQIVTQGVLMLDQSDIQPAGERGAGKIVVFRLSPTVLAAVHDACKRLNATQAQVVAACARRLVAQKQIAQVAAA